MKKPFKSLAVFFAAVLFVAAAVLPFAALAGGSRSISGDLDLVSGDHAGKTVESDGYSWDAESSTLTLDSISVTGSIIIPKRDVKFIVSGKCSAVSVTRNDSGANQALSVEGSGEGAELTAEFDLAGSFDVRGIKLYGGVSNGNVGSAHIFTLTDSAAEFGHMSWMTDGGISLAGSSLSVVETEGFLQFWAEKIAMDKKSVITSAAPLHNYGHFELDDIEAIKDYIVLPEGGRFIKNQDYVLTIVDANGEEAQSFTLRAPAEEFDITLSVTPEGSGAVSGGGRFEAGTSVSVKAETVPGYRFLYWEENGQSVSEDMVYTFTVTGNRELVAVFEEEGESSDPSGESSDPSGESSDPSGESSDPSGESSDPSGESSDPSGESSDPSGESSGTEGGSDASGNTSTPPQTGDTGSDAVWAVLLMASLTAAVCIAAAKKRSDRCE